MAAFPLRQNRINTDLELKVRLKENSQDKILKGEVSATVINISKGGACLVLPQILIDRTHLFFSTLRSDAHTTHTLVLEASQEAELELEFPIYAKSIWMDSNPHDSRVVFKVGIQFLAKQKELYESLKKIKR